MKNFRIAVKYNRDMDNFLHITPDRLSGPMGNIMHALFQSFIKNLTYVKALPGKSETYEVEKTNGSENTFFNLISRKEADIVATPFRYGQAFQGLETTGPAKTIQGGACHAPELQSRPRDLTTGLVIYNELTWFLIILACILVVMCLFYSKSNPNSYWRRICIFGTLSCLINQASMPAVVAGGAFVAVHWLWASFLLIELYINSMNTDMVANDYSNFIESPEDVFRLNTVPAFHGMDPFVASYATSADRRFLRLWNAPNKQVSYSNNPNVVYHISFKQVYIGTDLGVYGYAKMFCSKLDFKFLLADKEFGTVDLSFYYRNDLSDADKFYLNNRVRYGNEHDLSTGALNTAVKVADTDYGGTAACVRFRKEDLYDDVETLQAITVANSATLFVALLSLLLLAFAVFVLEIVLAKWNRARHFVNTN